MSDTLEIFGQEWTGVTGFKATDDNDTIKTFIRPQGTISISQNGTGIDVSQYASADVAVPSADFIVTVSYNSTSGMWEPDCTFAEYATAYSAGKTIVLEIGDPTPHTDANVTCTIFNKTNARLRYVVDVRETASYHGESRTTTTKTRYQFDTSGVDIITEVIDVSPSGTLSITQNGTGIDVAAYASVDVNVSGGSSKNIQVNSGSASVRTNGYTSTGLSLTVAKTGTYKASWTAWRSSSSGTMGTNLHHNNSSGTNNQTWTNTYGQHIVLNNQSYTAGDVLTLYATAGSTSRYCWVSNLIIEEQ